MSSPLAVPEPWNLVAAAYAHETVPRFEYFARQALQLTSLAPPARVVDVASGPGTLTRLAAQAGHRVSAIDFSPSMIAMLGGVIEREGLASLVDARVGDGMALPYADESFDAGFSMFGLMFFPDRERGLRELLRVVVPGAPVVISSWFPFESVPLMNEAFAALVELAPPPPGTPPFAPPLTASADCLAEMSAAGFRDVAVHDVTFESTISSVSEFWAEMVRTGAPIALRKAAMGASFDELSKGVLARLRAKFGDGPQPLAMPAHLTFGRR